MAKPTPTKSGKYKTDFYVNGERIREVLPTLKAAIAYENERKSTELTKLSTNMKSNFTKLKYKDIAFIYMAHLAETNAKSNLSYIRGAVKYWGEMKISLISVKLTKKWVESLFKHEKNYALSTIEKYLEYFKTSFTHAVKNEIIPYNPVLKVEFRKKFKGKTKRDITINREEYVDFYSLFIDCEPIVKNIVTCLWYTGMRGSEVRHLKWESVFINRGLILLQANTVKEKEIRTIGLEKEILDLLKSLFNSRKKNSVYVFSEDGITPFSYKTFNRRWNKAIKGTHYKLKPHDFRHCWSTVRRQEGHDREVIKAQLGHKTDSMFQHYNSVKIDEVVEAAGFYCENREIIEGDVRSLINKIKSNGISLGTLQSLIREFY